MDKLAEEILKKHLINTDWGDANDLERELKENRDQVDAIIRAMEEYASQFSQGQDQQAPEKSAEEILTKITFNYHASSENPLLYWKDAIQAMKEYAQLRQSLPIDKNATKKNFYDDVVEANGILRSCYQVIKREGKNTRWDALKKQVHKILMKQHKIMYPIDDQEPRKFTLKEASEYVNKTYPDTPYTSQDQQEVKSVEKILEKIIGTDGHKERGAVIHISYVLKAMEEYASQFRKTAVFHSEERQEVNYMQMRDLTDEEWMRLPKEDIIQYYKNCYKMLMQFASQRQEISDKPNLTSFKNKLENVLNDGIKIGLNDWAIVDYCKTFLETLRDKLTKQ